MINFEKIDPLCSNVYLIDENLCIGRTLDTINFNFQVLSDGLNYLTQYSDVWDDLYTITASYSAYWYTAAKNIDLYGAEWVETCTLVQKTSANWNKKFTLFFPKMQDIVTWYSLNTTQQDSIITNWLNINFNPNSYLNQSVEMVVYLNQTKSFDFTFNRSYFENCAPNAGGGSVSCSPCAKPHRGCNHHGGAAGYGPCTNAYDGCSAQSTSSNASFSCSGTGAKTLNIGLSRQASEINVARIIKITYTNINKVWTRIP